MWCVRQLRKCRLVFRPKRLGLSHSTLDFAKKSSYLERWRMRRTTGVGSVVASADLANNTAPKLFSFQQTCLDCAISPSLSSLSSLPLCLSTASDPKEAHHQSRPISKVECQLFFRTPEREREKLLDPRHTLFLLLPSSKSPFQ